MATERKLKSYLHAHVVAKSFGPNRKGHGHAEAGDDGYEGRNGRRGSVIAEQYEQGMRQPRGGGLAPEKPPSNEEVAKAVQQKVAVSQSDRGKGCEPAPCSASRQTYLRLPRPP